MYQRILLAYDGSPTGQKALLSFQDLSQWRQAKLTLLTVVPTLEMATGAVEMGYMSQPFSATHEDETHQLLDTGVQVLSGLGFHADGVLLKGETIREITRYAQEQQADLIVVGHKHEKSLLRRWWSGSTAKSLVEESPCNVLIVITPS